MFLETNKIVERDKAPPELQNNIPEWALYFEGIVSDGEQNRNWYIIQSNAWFFSKNIYVKDFLKTGSILYNHDSNKPIGRPLSFEKLDNWEIGVSWYVFDDVHTNWAIWRGLILWLSTGHITHESNWVNTQTKEEMENKKFWGEGWYDRYIDKNWVWQVLKAEIVEFSFTSTRSNRASIVANNMATTLWIENKEALNLLNNHNTMGDKKKENTVEEDVKTETPAVGEKKVEENSTEEKKEETNNPVKIDENQIAELKKDFLKEAEKNLLEKLTNSLDERFTELKKNFRESERSWVKALANTAWTSEKSLKNILKQK